MTFVPFFMTNEQEATHIHKLLDLMKSQAKAYDIASEGAQQAGFSSHEVSALVQRLQTESLAISTYGSSMTLTPLGLQIARGEGGYLGHSERQAREQSRKDRRDARSSFGSLLSGWAGIIGLLIAGFSLWESHRSSNDADDLRTQLKELQQKQITTEARLINLEEQSRPITHLIVTKPSQHTRLQSPKQ